MYTNNTINFTQYVTSISNTITQNKIDIDTLLKSVSMITKNNIDYINTIIDTFDSTIYRSVKYQIQIESAAGYQASDVLIIQNGTNSYLTEYGILETANSLGTFYTDIVTANVNLYFNPVNSNNAISFIRSPIGIIFTCSSAGDLMILSGSEDLMTGSGSEDLNI